MHNLSIHFSYPWLLLLLIPAIALGLLPYFRLSKKHRRTRNRITSIVLHLCVMFLSISVLAGLRFDYQLPNEENEIILLVDVSETEQQSAELRDDFVKTVLNDSQFDNYRVGVVTFGFDQQYAVPLTSEVSEIYEKYLESTQPDTSATDIAAALNYTKDLFKYPETAKIVLITDGKETDENAVSAIRAVTAQGIKVDAAYIPSSYEGEDIQVTGIEFPDTHINAKMPCEITVTVQSNVAGSATIELTDNGKINDPEKDRIENAELIVGTQTVVFSHTFEGEELHELAVTVAVDDLLTENNTYRSYLYLEIFNKILILERADGESDALINMINDEKEYEITPMNVFDEALPTTVDELRQYDQIILNNISYSDMTANVKDFDALLQSYIRDFGGGVLTVGGNDETGAQNMYDKVDLRNKIYQQFLPVQAINYTPPLGVMFIIDCSGSMDSTLSGMSMLDLATAGVSSCLNVLSERDYVGIMTLDSNYATILDLTPRSQESVIRNALNTINSTQGATVFPGAIERAGLALRGIKDKVDKLHMILVTDGGVPIDQKETYEQYIKDYYDNDRITLSVMGIGVSRDTETGNEMQAAADIGHGRLYCVTEPSQVSMMMMDELQLPEITGVTDKEFKPVIRDWDSPFAAGIDRGTADDEKNSMTVTLGGFYGVKIKNDAELVLSGDYSVPIYAQWKYGEGTVGSFMCDLQASDWSREFMEDPNGVRFIKNAINNLMPNENIRPKEINTVLQEENYINALSVYANLLDGEKVEGEITNTATNDTVSLNTVATGDNFNPDLYITYSLNADNNYSRCGIVVKRGGIYKITLRKIDANGNIIRTTEIYKTFAYSKEYDTFANDNGIDYEAKLKDIAERGNGGLIANLEDPVEIFSGFITAIDRSYDPTTLFVILAIVLFLLDVAVRKFKFKWIHEIVRDYRNKRKENPKDN